MANAIVTKGKVLPNSATKTDVYDMVDNARVEFRNIVNADINESAAIADSKLGTISTIGKVNLSALTLAGQTTGDLLYSSDGVTFTRLPIGTTGQKLKLNDSRVVVDYMEYANNALARAAYVSSDKTPTYSSDLCTGGTAICSSAPAEAIAQAFDNNMDTRYRSSEAGSDVNGIWAGYHLTSAIFVRKITIENKLAQPNNTPATGMVIYSDNGSDWTEHEAINLVADAGLQSYVISESAAAHAYWAIKATANLGGGENWWIYEMQMMNVTDEGNLQTYSEATIKNQGTYSLKGIAKITDSLNDTITGTLAAPVDLTDKLYLIFYIRSSRTGANIKIGIHDTGGTTSEKTYTVLAVNTWEKVTWDISAITNANKNAIDKVVITILNADAANTFYIDNMYAVITEVPALVWTTV